MQTTFSAKTKSTYQNRVPFASIPLILPISGFHLDFSVKDCKFKRIRSILKTVEHKFQRMRIEISILGKEKLYQKTRI